MEKEKKPNILAIKWDTENYLYSHNFSMQNIGLYQTKIYYKDIELKKPEFVYKFYNKSNFSINSLLESYLHFSNPRTFNDPFDCITNRETYILKGGPEIVKHRDDIGVCCFSLINNNPLMWGHYANSYTGFCLKFDHDLVLKNQSIQIRNNVSYLKSYQPSNPSFKTAKNALKALEIEDDLKQSVISTIDMLNEYSWKYHDWKYEKEYRAISINSNDFDRKLKFKKEGLLEIYIGYQMKKMDPNFYNLLCYILKKEYPNVRIFEVKPHPLIVKLEFEEIENNAC